MTSIELLYRYYDCEILCENKNIEKPDFEQIFRDNVREQIMISRIFEKKFEQRTRRKEENPTHGDLPKRSTVLWL